MSKSPKLLRAFFRGTEQRIKIFDGTDDSKIMQTIKRVFNISEDITKIFLQDGDGDILVLPDIIPNGLCVYVYVEPTLVPSIPATPSSSLLSGFKWQATKSGIYYSPIITNNGYTISSDESQNTSPAPAISTTTYDKGKLFVKFNAKIEIYQCIGVVPSNYTGDPFYLGNDENVPIILTTFFVDENQYDKVHTIALYVDIDNKIAKFFWLVEGRVMNVKTRAIPEVPVKIYGWTKHREMTIMEGGSSPIPSFV